MKKINFIRVLVVCLTGLLVVPSRGHASSEEALEAFRQEFMRTYPGFPLPREMPLEGIANGGQLYLMKRQPLCLRYASIQTTQGESAELVLRRLANTLNADKANPFGWRNGNNKSKENGAQVVGDTLVLPGFLPYAFSTTDSGFDLPKPVFSVSGMYDAEKKQVKLWWINPSNACDEIIVAGATKLPPNSTHCVLDWTRPTNGIFDAWLGVEVRRGKFKSPPANIDLTVNSQEELTTFPFYMGVAPNWSPWSDANNLKGAIFEQGFKPGVPSVVCIDSPWEKPFYQIVKPMERGIQAGVWRRFFGLKPGHTYKVEVSLNTLEMDACTNGWAFSFHAAYDKPDGGGLTVNQMAGKAALPDGSMGPKAGCVALYEPNTTTMGQWRKRTTDMPGPGLEIKNITLPKDVTSITVWLRHSGANSTGVGMDWIKLTDVTTN